MTQRRPCGAAHAALAALALLMGGCAGLRPSAPAWRPADGLVAWTRVDSLSGGGVEVFTGHDARRPLRAWAVRIDERRADVETRVAVAADTGNVRETTSTFAREARACVAVNGGYFRMGAFPATAVGWLAQGGRTLAPPTAVETRGGVAYPTARAALGLFADGRAEVAWAAVRPDASVGRLSMPVATRQDVPAGAVPVGDPWPVRDALGAGPMLLRGGGLRVTAAEEVFFGTSIPAVHPRTAVGVAADGALVVVLVDGRQAGSAGVDLNDLARLMQAAGARDALNLDGGGSSTVVVRGVRLNRPVGGAVEREVHNALVTTCAR